MNFQKLAHIIDVCQQCTYPELDYLCAYLQGKLANFYISSTGPSGPPCPAGPPGPFDQFATQNIPENNDGFSHQYDNYEGQSVSNVKWSDIVAKSIPETQSGPNAQERPPVRTLYNPNSSKKPLKLPPSDRAHKTTEQKHSKGPKGQYGGVSLGGDRRKVPRKLAPDNPQSDPLTGESIMKFCQNPECSCEYVFRDVHSMDDMVGGVVKPLAEDPVRKNSGLIYENQLYVRNWDPEKVNWETVRDRIRDELEDFTIPQTFVDPKGYAFLTFEDHETATRAQKALREIPSFYGNQLLVNFATTRSHSFGGRRNYRDGPGPDPEPTKPSDSKRAGEEKITILKKDID